MRKIIFLAFFLFVFSFFLRVYKVSSTAQGIHADEASWGYNAYSILKTGKDEHGVKYPLVFEAFGDQKLPAYIYFIIPFIKVFDLNLFSVRLPAVIVGSLVSVVIFLLSKEWGYSIFLSFIGGLIVSVSSWSIVLSRSWGYDSNLGLLFFLLGLLFTFHAINFKKKLFFVFGGIFLGLSVYSYISFRLISPLIILLIIICFFFKKPLFQKKVNLAIFIFSFIIIIFPFLILPFYHTGTIRFKQVSFTPNLGMVLKINEERAFCTKFFPKPICYLISNKGQSYFNLFISRYGYVYSLNYLFFDGENNFPFLNVNNQGLLPLLLFPFYVLGLLVVFCQITKKTNLRKNLFLLGGMIISTLPANLVDEPQRVRVSGLLFFVIILILIGINQLTIWLKRRRINYKYVYLIITFYLIISGSIFIIKFLSIHLYKHEYVYRTYMKDLMLYLYRQSKQKKKIFIKSIDEGITFYAFFNKINPSIFQKEVVRQKRSETGFIHPLRFNSLVQTHLSIEETYCQCLKNNEFCLYIYNEDKGLGPAEKVFFTENKVHKLMYIYNLNKIQKGKIQCLE